MVISAGNDTYYLDERRLAVIEAGQRRLRVIALIVVVIMTLILLYVTTHPSR